MALRNQTNNNRSIGRSGRSRRAAAAEVEVEIEETVWAPSTGAYITDGTGLFRVADAISTRGELFLELEDCRTLELILCQARTVARLGLRKVTPAPAR
ncbi:MAG TPA: hypothetical protein VMU32_01900 [Solirubrobacteraceae bacterium]|nr:hypothetical protein [Solirubrobacteraceae bacterium]